jgi:hypothetical protein
MRCINTIKEKNDAEPQFIKITCNISPGRKVAVICHLYFHKAINCLRFYYLFAIDSQWTD